MPVYNHFNYDSFPASQNRLLSYRLEMYKLWSGVELELKGPDDNIAWGFALRITSVDKCCSTVYTF